MRAISEAHLNAYKTGVFKNLFTVIKEDPELSFEIRKDNDVMIYYRKDKILTTRYTDEQNFKITALNKKYYKNANPPATLFKENINYILNHTTELRNYFKDAKKLVHAYKMGQEFEIQQNIALGNHDFGKRFLVVDMEWQFAQSEINKNERISKTRVDLIVVDLWSNSVGQNDIYLTELKVGTGATEGKSGTIDHVKKTKEIIDKPEARNALVEDVGNIIEQKCALGLIEGTKPILKLSSIPKMMIILAYRGQKEKMQLTEQAELAKSFAKEIGMVEPMTITHNAQIDLEKLI